MSVCIEFQGVVLIMIIIKISKKFAKIVIILLLLLSLSFNVYGAVRAAKLEARHNSLLYMTNFFDTSRIDSIASAIDSIEVAAGKNDPAIGEVEVFDVKKGEVIKKIKNTSIIQNEAEKIVEGITGYNPKVKAITESGYIIRIPMTITETVKYDQLFLIITGKEKPYILVIDKNLRPFLYNFEGDIENLLKIIDFDPGFKMEETNE
jgi:hypothetical protein